MFSIINFHHLLHLLQDLDAALSLVNHLSGQNFIAHRDRSHSMSEHLTTTLCSIIQLSKVVKV
jgi:hypothetical protein